MANEFNFKAGDVIFRSGQVTIQFMQLMNGEVELKKGEEVISKRNVSGTLIGVIPAMEKIPMPYDVIAVEPTKVKFIDIHPAKVKKDLLEDPLLALELSSNLATEIYESMAKTEFFDKIMNEMHDFLHDLYLFYYNIAEDVIKDFDRLRIPWLKDIYEEATQTLTYRYGKINSKEKMPYSEPFVYVYALDPDALSDSVFNKYEIVNFKAGEIISKVGQIADEFYILLDGKVDIVISKRKTMTITGRGACIGEIELLMRYKTIEKTTRNSTYITNTDCSLIHIPTPRLYNIFKENPQLGLYLFHLMRFQYPMLRSEYIRVKSIIERYIDDISENVTDNVLASYKKFQNILAKAEDNVTAAKYLDPVVDKQRHISRMIRKYKQIYKKVTDLSISIPEMESEIKKINAEFGVNIQNLFSRDE